MHFSCISDLLRRFPGLPRVLIFTYALITASLSLLFFIESPITQTLRLLLACFVISAFYTLTISIWHVLPEDGGVVSMSGLLLFSVQFIVHGALAMLIPVRLWYSGILVADAALVSLWMYAEADHLWLEVRAWSHRTLRDLLVVVGVGIWLASLLPLLFNTEEVTYVFIIRMILLGLGYVALVVILMKFDGPRGNLVFGVGLVLFFLQPFVHVDTPGLFFRAITTVDILLLACWLALELCRSFSEFLNTGTVCLICVTGEVSVMFIPCGHASLCLDCANKMRNCPTCSVRIEKLCRVYYSGFK